MGLFPEDAPPSIYGADGEPRFFHDPAMDRVITVLLNLASELWIQTERVETLNAIILDKGVASEADLAAVIDRDDGAREAQLTAFVSRVLAPLREVQG